MRILLDECVPRKLRHSLPGHACLTASDAGFDVLLTTDAGAGVSAESRREAYFGDGATLPDQPPRGPA